MSCKIEVRQQGGVTILDCSGRFTLGEGSSTFRNTIKELVTKGNRLILVDLGEVRYVDSSFIGELFSAFGAVKQSGGVFKLLNLTRRINDLLQVTKLFDAFNVFDNEERAIASFGEHK